MISAAFLAATLRRALAYCFSQPFPSPYVMQCNVGTGEMTGELVQVMKKVCVLPLGRYVIRGHRFLKHDCALDAMIQSFQKGFSFGTGDIELITKK